MLEVRSLVIERDQQKLHYDFELAEYRTLAVKGVSGVGKSTLLQAIAGFVEPEQGRILWHRAAIEPLPVEQRPVSYLFQMNNLFEHISARSNLELGFSKQVPWSQLNSAAQALNVADQLHKLPVALSGGQRQRVALIRTLMRPEPIVLLDEPFAELDHVTRQIAADWVAKTATEKGKTMIIVTHQDEDVAMLADQVLELRS